MVGRGSASGGKDFTGDQVLTLPGFRIGRPASRKVNDEKLRGIAGTSQVEVNAGRTGYPGASRDA